MLKASKLSMRSHTRLRYLVNLLSWHTYCFLICLMTISESPNTCKILAFFLIASNNPWINDSYSATLSVQGNCNLWAAKYVSPQGLVSSKPALDPCFDFEPSNLKVHAWSSSFFSCSFCEIVITLHIPFGYVNYYLIFYLGNHACMTNEW